MKIKSVNIVGFRSYAYDGDGLFNFVGQDNEIANFVVIFGPNGFGKSSIYDAIEWSMTNSISRFNRDSQRISNNATSLALNQKGIAQHILRNRYIEDNDPSFVVVETTIHPTFNRPVKKAKSGGRDYKFDPKDTEASTKHLAEIFLSQDAIDSFLKEERAESRYEKFMAAFGGEDELYRQKLALLKRTSRNERDKLSSQIETIEPDLSASVQEDAISHVLHTLSRISEHDLQFENVDLDFNVTKNIENQNRILRYREDYANRITNLQNSVELVDIASIKALEYSDIFFRIKSFEVELALKLDHREAITAVDNINSEIGILENLRNTVLASLNECRLHQKNISRFLNTNEQLKSISVDIDKLRRAKDGLLSVIAENLSNKISKDKFLVEVRQRLIKEQDNQTQLPVIFRSLEQVENDLKALVSVQVALIDARPDLLSHAESEKTKRQELLSMLIEKSMLPESILRLTDSSEISHRLATLKNDELDAAERLISYRALLSQLISHDEGVSEILRLGSELLSHTHSDTCPLCSHRYASHDELLLRIHSSGDISSEKLSILKLIDADEKKIASIHENISKCLSEIAASRNQKIAAQDMIISEAISSIQKCDKEISDSDLQIKRLNDKKTGLMKQTMGLTEIAAREHLEQSIANVASAIEQLEAEIIAIDNTITSSRNNLAEFDAKVAYKEEIILNSTQEQYYVGISSYFQRNGVTEGQEHSFIEKKIAEFDGDHSSVIISIDQKRGQLRASQDSLSKFNFPNDSFLIEEKITSLEENISAARSSLKSIWDSLVNAGAIVREAEVVAVEVINQTLLELREKHEAERKTCIEVISILNLLANQLELALKFSESSRLRDRIRLLKENICAHEDFEKSIDKEYLEIEKRLKTRINEFFYSDLINNIYSKIDPHPTFKRIDFTSVFPENNDKPRLEIFLREEDGEPISPNFYFSAAQLNVLSLSIFLARALHVKHEGKPVQSILIDDPIQSMDSINILSTIDLLRGISQKFDRQIILSTHDENFYELLKMKVPASQFNSKFIKLSEHGKVEVDSTSELVSPILVAASSNDGGEATE